MKVQLKIYNIDIVDCSSCPNTIYPDPESRDILLEILIRVCESDVVFRIGKFKFWLDNIELQSPNVYGTNYKDWKDDDSIYDFQTGKETEINKLLDLHVEREEDARERIKKIKYFERQNTKRAYYIEPGLKGIKKGINYINALYNNQRRNLPDYLKDLNLKHFRFESGVIWRMDQEWKTSRDEKYYSFNYENDYIMANSTSSGFIFEFGNFGGDSYDIYAMESYLRHLDSIQEILEEIAPGKYEADPLDRDALLKAGFLEREGRKHIVPNIENLDDMIDKVERIQAEISRKEMQKERVQDIILEQKVLPIDKLAQVLHISNEDAENVINELVSEGIKGILQAGVFKFTNEPREVIIKLFELIEKL